MSGDDASFLSERRQHQLLGSHEPFVLHDTIHGVARAKLSAWSGNNASRPTESHVGEWVSG